MQLFHLRKERSRTEEKICLQEVQTWRRELQEIYKVAHDTIIHEYEGRDKDKTVKFVLPSRWA